MNDNRRAIFTIAFVFILGFFLIRLKKDFNSRKNSSFEITEKEIIDHCHENIAGFKCPKSVSFRVEPMPVSGAGKILKTELRKPFWKDQSKQVN